MKNNFLNQFVNKDKNTSSGYLQEFDGYIYSNYDNSFLVRTLGSVEEKPKIQFEEGIKSNIENIFEKDKTLLLGAYKPSQIQLLLDELLTKEEFVKDYYTNQCNECKGNGTVEWEYKSYLKEDDCPICDGNGDFKRKLTKPILEDSITIQLFSNYAFRSLILSFLAKFSDTIKFYEVDDFQGLVCESGQYELIIMPVQMMYDWSWYDVTLKTVQRYLNQANNQ